MIFLFLILSLNNFKLLKNDLNEIKLEYFPSVKIDTIDNSYFFYGERYIKFESGYPDLPSILIPIEIPEGYEYSVGYEIKNKITLSKKLKVKRVPAFKKEGLYFYEEEKKFSLPFPDKIILDKGVSYLRFKKVLYLILFPVQIKNEAIDVIKNITIKITLKKKKGKDFKIFKEKIEKNKFYEKLIKTGVTGYKENIKPQGFFEKTDLWLKIHVKRNGIYYITYKDIKDLLGIAPENLDLSKICLYARLKALSPDPDSFDVRLNKVPYLFVDRGEKNIFDANDTLFFVGFKAEGYRPEKGKIYYYYHPYTSESYYFLSFEGDSGIKVPKEEGSPSGDVFENKGIKVTRHEKNLYNLAKAGLRWVGERVSDRSIDLSLKFFNPLNDSAKINFVFIRRESDVNNPLPLDIDLLLNNDIIYQRSFAATIRPLEALIRIKVPLTSNPLFSLNVRGVLNVDYFEVVYNSKLENIKDSIGFFVFLDQVKNFVLKGNFSKKGKLFKVLNPFNYREIENFYFSVDSLIFSVLPEPDTFYIIYSEKYIHPFIERFERKNIKVDGAHFLIIGPEEFRSAFSIYINWRRNNFYIDTLKIENPIIKYINVEDIFEEYGFGIKDPVAIRNFLKSVYLSSNPVPYYVLLAGKGTYDFRNFLNSGIKNYIPPFEWGYGVDINNPPFTYDDFFVEFDPGVFDPDMVIGRIPAKNQAEMLNFLNRIITYEKGVKFSNFKNKILGVADDTTAGGSFDGINHTSQVTRVLSGLPNSLEKRGFYLIDYPYVGGRKPQATDELLSLIDEGYAFVFFFIHGNPNQLAHEELLKIDDIDLMRYRETPSFILLGSCKTLNFDRPEGAIGEKWLMKNGIGALGSTYLTFPSENEFLIDNFFDNFMDYKIHTFGECAYIARFGKPDYVYLGDPTTFYAFPRPSGNFIYKPDSLYVSYYKFFGDTLKFFRTLDSLIIDFNEKSEFSFLNIETPPYIDTLTFTKGFSTYRYYLYRKGTPLFKGTATYKNGYKFKFYLPQTNSNFLRVLSYNPSQRGEVLYVDSFPVKLSTEETVDLKGPSISLSINGKKFSEGDTFKSRVELFIELSDESGINISRKDGIQISLDGNIFSLSDKFIYNKDDYRNGHVIYKFSGLSPGFHNLSISAYDIFDNRGEFFGKFFVTTEEESLFVKKVIPYPNPASEYFFIGFDISKSALCKLKIYTMRGKPVYETNEIFFPSGFNSLKWKIGKEIANGIYIYLLEIKDLQTGEKIKKRGKVIVYR